jgi:hypothetical protein
MEQAFTIRRIRMRGYSAIVMSRACRVELPSCFAPNMDAT